ncbi:hypothetical protein JQ625_20465 [Bradyrhizobium diazoefficiens]|nr:hypothetical protein [Bradyrhizobium diazoefficiens]MBR0777220.1 hypothetical protein [Bradyrhizobium diazoefficiens]
MPFGDAINGKPFAADGLTGAIVSHKKFNHNMCVNWSKARAMLFDRLFATLVVLSGLFSTALIGVILFAL